MMDYFRELMDGRAIVIVPNEENKDYDVAVFWLFENNIYVWGREIGTIEWNGTIFDLYDHFDRMTSNGYHLFARGRND